MKTERLTLDASDRIEQLERALKVIYVWSEVAMERMDVISRLDPAQVARLCRNTLEYGRKDKKQGGQRSDRDGKVKI
jgi:hypothetical protein